MTTKETKRETGKTKASSDVVLPHFPEAERVILGAILLNESRDQFGEIYTQLDASDFFLPTHQTLFRSMSSLYQQGAAIHISALLTDLTRLHKLDDVGGPAALGRLTDGVPRSSDLRFEIQQIKEAAAKRKLQTIANKALDSASNGHSSEDVIGELEKQIKRIKSEANHEAWSGDYRAGANGLERRKPERYGGKTVVPLCNFTARIIGDVIEDDGSGETQRCYEIEARLVGESVSRRSLIKAAEFSNSKWVDEVLGAKATVNPQQWEYVKCAIKLISDAIQAKRVITHTGWRNDGEGWLYYHGGGAIGAPGLVEAEVRLPLSLAPFVLPAPPSGEALTRAIRSVMFVLDVVPDEISIPLIGSVFASVLGGADFSLQITGYTGAGKSQLAVIAQSFFGSGFDASNIPASWSSSANSLEGVAHTTKDAVLVVDDFCPTGSANEVAKLHAAAERLFRAQGNHSGRGRMRADGSLRAIKPPRGLVISTGEDTPKGQSLRARLVILEIEQGLLKWDVLTACQKAARDAQYAKSMTGFLQWLATDERINKIQTQQSEKFQIHSWREEWLTRGLDGHKRNATSLAYLSRAWYVWLEFAKDRKAITSPEAAELWARVWKALGKIGLKQSDYQSSENPALRFIELLQSAFASNKAYLDAIDGGSPENSDSYGWRSGVPQGDRVGWLAKDGIYLIPDSAYSIAQRAGEGLTVTQPTLWKRLKEGGFLMSAKSDGKDERIKTRKTIKGVEYRIIHLKPPKKEPENSPEEDD